MIESKKISLDKFEYKNLTSNFVSKKMKRVDLKYEKKMISICKYIKGKITTYPHAVWSKFKLLIYGLKLDTLPT